MTNSLNRSKMRLFIKPTKERWKELIQRGQKDSDSIAKNVEAILKRVQYAGDRALKELTLELDGAKLHSILATEEQIVTAASKIEPSLKDAIEIAIANIFKFHSAQDVEWPVVESTPGVKCWTKSTPIDRVGLYVPGGSAPLFSTLLMLGVPAKIAGCRDILITTPPNCDGELNPAIAYCALRLELKSIALLGGAQAIGAMAYGTESIKARDKIFGPGNRYVTMAKEQLSSTVAIDMPAGPSELMVIADQSANPRFIAADLLSQAEHGADSQLVLLSTSEEFVKKVLAFISEELDRLPRRELSEGALKNSFSMVLSNQDEIVQFANLYAPEHLIISTENQLEVADKIVAAGSIFIGEYSPVSAGDYCSGTNHTLPTSGWARSVGGVTLESFRKRITLQQITAEGLLQLSETICTMAEAEGLQGHSNVVKIRVEEIRDKNYEKEN